MGTAAQIEGTAEVNAEYVRNALFRAMRRFDKGGDQFYDQISALHKSLRGSSPDATLYWLGRMLDGGADPLYIARRLIRAAVEDVGLADPQALRIALDAAETYERLGSGRRAQAAAPTRLLLRATPAYAYTFMVLHLKRQTRPVGASAQRQPGWKELGFDMPSRQGKHAAGENYFPDGMPEVKFTSQPRMDGNARLLKGSRTCGTGYEGPESLRLTRF
jgi:putative ATPase